LRRRDDQKPVVVPARGLIVAAVLAASLALAAYFYFDGLIDFMVSLARGKPGAAQVHIRY
jgi:hypothetical protein